MKLAAGLVLLLVPTTAHADRRGFTHTYEYMTQPESETEVEVYTEQARTTLGSASDKTFTLELAIEHGITRRWDVALFHVFRQVEGAAPEADDPFGLDAMMLRNRYRFAERGQWPVNVLAYADVKRSFADPIWDAEVRAVITRDFDSLTFAVNLIGDVEFGPTIDEPVISAGWAAGVGYELMPELEVGAESWGGFDIEHTDVVEASAGPVVAWAPSSTLWMTATVGFALTEYAEDLDIRGVVGMHLP